MYDSYFPYYDSKYTGLPLISKDGITQTQLFVNYPGFGGGYAWQGSGYRVGYATGRYGEYSGRMIMQVFMESSEYAYGWIYADEYRVGSNNKSYTAANVQTLVNTIIANNQKIVVENLVSARLIQIIESKGTKVSDDIKNTVRSLQTRVNERDSQLAKNEYLTDRQIGAPDMDAKYINALNSLMGAKIGVVLTLSVTTIIIVSLLIGAATATALYFALRGNASQSASDYKLAKKTQEVLKKLSPEDAAQVESEIKSAWNAGYKIGGNSSLKNIGILAAGAGIFFLAKPIGQRLGLTKKS